jgi:hypothetical protein
MKTAVTALAGPAGGPALDKLIPAVYTGQNTTERLEAYAADLARKVRVSFPAQVTARMIDNKELPVDQAAAPKVSAFLRAAAPAGYEIGRTPLHAFLNNRPTGVPALDEASTRSLKTLHRLYQVTPSPEAFSTVMSLGFTSAYDIASYRKNDFLDKYGDRFASRGEAELVTAGATDQLSRSISSPWPSRWIRAAVYGPPVRRGLAEPDAIVQQFPTMASSSDRRTIARRRLQVRGESCRVLRRPARIPEKVDRQCRRHRRSTPSWQTTS